MKSSEDSRLSLTECKRILGEGELSYTDDEIICLRDFLYHLADIAIDNLNNRETAESELTNKDKPKNNTS